MKKFVTLITFLIIASSLFAQRGRVSSALNHKESDELDKAYETIMEALDPENSRASNTIEWPRTWHVKGQILQDIHRKGVKNIVDEPLFKAHDAFKRAVELDDRGRMERQLQVDFTFLQTNLSNYAVMAFENSRFDVALECFERFMEISNMDIMKPSEEEVIDTAIIYNAGLAAYRGNNFEKALEYFKRSAELDYNGVVSYQLVYEIYKEQGDSIAALETIQEGFQNYPDEEQIITLLINYYIQSDNQKEAFEYLDIAIAQNPENASYYTAKGSTLERLGRIEEAIEAYEGSIKVDSTFFTPYYNLGVIYYNRGVTSMNDASQLPPSETEKYDAKMEEGIDYLKEALPYFEKAYELDSTELAVLETLRVIYYRLQKMDKYEEMNEKVQSISN